MFLPILYTIEEIYQAVERLIRENLEIFQRLGHALDPLAYPNIIYAPEATKLNVYANVLDIFQRGKADCEDLAAWLVAYLRWNGFEALPLVTQQTPTLFHVLVTVKLSTGWVALDPSKWKGMSILQ